MAELIEVYTKELAVQPDRSPRQQQAFWLKGILRRARYAPKGADTVNTSYMDSSGTMASTLCDPLTKDMALAQRHQLDMAYIDT